MKSSADVAFVLGHMGGNRIVLLDGKAVEGEGRLEAALRALGDFGLKGHQAGWLLEPRDGGTVRLRIVSFSWRDFIPACGGLTQVLGKALWETTLGRRHRGRAPRVDEGTRVLLETDGGPVEVLVEVEENRVQGCTTDMASFVERAHAMGIHALKAGPAGLWRVGDYLVIDGDALTAEEPELRFERMGKACRNRLPELQALFLQETGLDTKNVALFDRKGKGAGGLRSLFPHDVTVDHVEASCGTGSTALALALHAMGEGPADGRFVFECGGAPRLGGPDHLAVQLEMDGAVVTGASFRHDNVEIVAEGVINVD